MLIILMLSCSPASAEVAGEIATEQQPLVRREVTNTSDVSPEKSKPAHSTSYDIWRVAGALAVVLALILLLKWGGARFMAPGARARSTQAVQIVSRSVVAPRQQIMLVQVGRRLVVVGDCGTSMSPLCEISDPDEVASLLGQIRDERSVATKSFKNLFGTATDRFTEESKEAADEVQSSDAPEPKSREVETARAELGDLMSKVRQLSAQFRRE